MIRAPKSARNDRWAAAILAVALGCGEPTPEIQRELVEVALPSDLEELDPPVKRQLTERWQVLTRLRTEPGAHPSRLANAYGQLAMVLHAYQYLDEAAAGYTNARHLDPTEFRWAYYLGRVERSRGQWQAAEAALAAALTLDPSSQPAQLAAADTAFDLGRTGDAERLWRQVLSRDPTSAAALVGIARLEIAGGHPAQAVSHLEAALRQQPGAAPIHYLLGQAHRALGDLDAARRHLEAIPAHNLEQEPVATPDPWLDTIESLRTGARAHDLRALRAAATGRHALAIIEYQQALAIDPDRIYARYGLAASFLALGDPVAARRELELLLAADPNHTPSLQLLASLLADAGELETAADLLRRAGELAPHDAAIRRAQEDLRARRAVQAP